MESYWVNMKFNQVQSGTLALDTFIEQFYLENLSPEAVAQAEDALKELNLPDDRGRWTNTQIEAERELSFVGLRALIKVLEGHVGQIPTPHCVDIAYELSQKQDLPRDYQMYLTEYLEDSLGAKNQQEVTAKMKIRYDMRQEFPEYMPDQAPKSMERKLFTESDRKVTPDNRLHAASRAGKIREVQDGSYRLLTQPTRLDMYAADGRKGMRVTIDADSGRMQFFGDPFDTSGHIAHLKKDYMAITCNVFGEMSVFDHKANISENFYDHSQTNKGAPLFFAGEVKSRDGLILGLDDYSGHHETTLYNLYKFTKFLQEQGADLSQCELYVFDDPRRDPLFEDLKVEQVDFVAYQRQSKGYSDEYVEDPTRGTFDKPKFKVNALDFLEKVKALKQEEARSENQAHTTPEVHQHLQRMK